MIANVMRLFQTLGCHTHTHRHQRQLTARQDCSLLSFSSWRLRRPLGALDPCGPPSLILFYTPVTHTHTHTHSHGSAIGNWHTLGIDKNLGVTHTLALCHGATL